MDKQRIESASDLFEGQVAHLTGESADGFWVIDVWESEDAFALAGEQLGPVMERIGVAEEPKIFPVHTFAARS